MKILNACSGVVIADNVEIVRNVLAQVKGLIGRQRVDEGYAMVFPGCKQVHTFFMRFPIDVVFVNKENVVICIVNSLPRNRCTEFVFGSALAIEFPAGTVSKSGLRLGDMLSFEKNTI